MQSRLNREKRREPETETDLLNRIKEVTAPDLSLEILLHVFGGLIQNVNI